MSESSKFFTPVHFPSQQDKIFCQSKILTIGSCFSDNIGKKLIQHGFSTRSNPFAIIFNPVSIARMITRVLNETRVKKEELSNIMQRYFHYDFHSSFDHTVPDLVLENINYALSSNQQFIKEVDTVIITLGTSIVYRHIESNTIVSNCHKVPGNQFDKEMLSIEHMKGELLKCINNLQKLNPGIKIILTVSPVRHTKEGVIENSLSKARLIALSHALVQENEGVSYFPAFELMMDELRDYRFYEADLIHPNQQAIDIIWSRFIHAYFNEKALKKVADFRGLNSALHHKPFDVASPQHQKFVNKQLEKIKDLKKSYPEFDFQEMVHSFESQRSNTE
ncbi:MAG: GSCFA domain-containing protein [Saprospiraceae bacterium]|nr:GSCFA domain-containing protein [Saprospiraceae bacterium]